MHQLNGKVNKLLTDATHGKVSAASLATESAAASAMYCASAIDQMRLFVEDCLQRADLGRRDARVIEPDHEAVGNACCSQGLEKQVCAVVLGSTQQQPSALHSPVHL